jgi:glycosyltransferase involved in cell wall biosynthesis/SAM-dependent methyltransferase
LKQLRIALFTPLPPARTGTADYGAALASALEKVAALTVFDKVPPAFDPGQFDRVVYQIGNNQYHSDIYELALRHPGVVVLHEASVHYLVRSRTINRGDYTGYFQEVLYEIFGSGGSYPAGHLPIEIPQPHEFLMLRRLIDRSQACIVHSRYAERLVRLKGFRGRIGVVPHGASLPAASNRDYYRAKLGLLPDTPLIGVFGYQRPDKQIWECMLMFQQLLASFPQARLLILGEQHPQVPVEAGIRDFGLQDRVSVMGYQPLHAFDGFLDACDVILNLRQTTFGESSGTMMRAFSLGKPVIVSAIGAASELPDDVCVKIPRDRHEMQVIVECLKWLLATPADAVEIGAQAKRWISEQCSWDIVARRYMAFLESEQQTALPAAAESSALSDDAVSKYLTRWIDPASPAAGYFHAHVVRLPRTLQLTPPGDHTSRILELGCYMQITPALRGLLGYGEVSGAYMGSAGGRHRSSVTSVDGEEFHCTIDLFNCEVDRFPYPDESFDTVLCCELLEHLQRDPMHMMAEIHRVLKPHGTLVLTTPNAVSIRSLRAIVAGIHPNLFSKYVMPVLLPETMHVREYTPKELLRLFADSGFSIQYIDTTPYGERPAGYKWITRAIRLLKRYTRLREDCVCLVGQKTNAVASRYPGWLYEPM